MIQQHTAVVSFRDRHTKPPAARSAAETLIANGQKNHADE
jgi:hypothetical protein